MGHGQGRGQPLGTGRVLAPSAGGHEFVPTSGIGWLWRPPARLPRHRPLQATGSALTVLGPTSRWISDVSVGDGGRTGRAVLGWASRQFEVDLDGGGVLHQPRDIERRARLTPRVRMPVWHPAKDLVAFRRREERIDVLRTDGTPVTWLRSGGWPVAWLPGDDSLLVINGTPPDVFLERWRLVPPPGR